MLFGCCASNLDATESRTGYEMIPVMAKAGFDYVELPLAPVMDLPEDRFVSGLLPAVRDGLPCLRMNVFFPGSLRLTGPEADHPAALEYARRALDRAARLGCQVVVMGSGGARNLPRGCSHQEGSRQLTDFLTALAPVASGAGIKIAIEHLNKLESNIVTSYREGLRLAQAVGAPSIGMLLDTFHLNMVSEPLSHIEETPELLWHVHIAGTLGRRFPAQGDGEDYPGLFKALRAVGYDGTISLEAHRQADGPKEASEALKVLKAASQA